MHMPRLGRIIARFPRSMLAGALACALLIGGLSVLASYEIGLINRIDHWSGDWRTALLSRATDKSHPLVELVLIDEETLERYGTETRSPTDRGLLAALVQALCAGGPKVVALDFIFDLKTAKDPTLLSALKTASCPIVLGVAAPPIPMTRRQQDYQAEFLKQAGLPYGYLNIATEFDNVVRVQGEPDEEAAAPLSFAEAIAKAASFPAGHEQRRISWLTAKSGRDAFNHLPAFLFMPGLNENEKARATLASRLQGRIVLVGLDLNDVDRHWTPLSKMTGDPMLGTLIQAHLTAQIIDGRGDYDLSLAAKGIAAGLIAFLGILVGFARLLPDSMRIYGPAALYLAADAIAFTKFSVTLPFAILAMAWVLGLFCGRGLEILHRKNRSSLTMGLWRPR